MDITIKGYNIGKVGEGFYQNELGERFYTGDILYVHIEDYQEVLRFIVCNVKGNITILGINFKRSLRLFERVENGDRIISIKKLKDLSNEEVNELKCENSINIL